MYMGYISNDNQNQSNPEAIGEKGKEKEPTPEEIAAGEQRAAEWNEALGVEPEEPADFSESMADVIPFPGNAAAAETTSDDSADGEPAEIIPFPGAAEATIAGATAGIALDTAAAIGETPNAEEEEKKKKKEGEEDEEEEDTGQTEVYNEDGEQQRTINTVTEDAAKEQIKSNDVDVSNLVQNVAGTLPGGEETIVNDAAAASTNISQAENAANGLVTKVAAGESDGTEEGENVLNAAMVSAANMSVTAEKAATEVINEQSDAEISVEEAKSAIAQTESTTEALSQAATQVQDPELVAKMQKGVTDIKAELTRSQDLLAEAVDTMAQKAEEEEKEEGEEGDEQDGDLLEEKIEVENTETLPGQMDADAIKRMTAEREEKQKAAAAAKKAEAEQATDENMSSKRAIYG